ncbi:hypothetical protein A2U01_0113607, partial [Trifolium medium]|nr:hypothetical protein [Trifolium medium]
MAVEGLGVAQEYTGRRWDHPPMRWPSLCRSCHVDVVASLGEFPVHRCG